MIEGERPLLILRRIQSCDPAWPSSDDYTIHVDERDQSVGRIFWRYAAHPEGLPWMWTVEGGGLCRQWPMRPYIRGHMGHRATPGEGHTALVKRRLTCRRRRRVPRQDLQPVLLVGPRAARRE